MSHTPPSFTPAHARQHGISIIEGVLYLAITASAIGFSAYYIQSELDRQETISIAREIGFYTAASQDFVSGEYNRIRRDLLDASDGPGGAVVSFGLEDLAEEGYLPAVLADGSGPLGQSYGGKTYRLLARAVSGEDTGVPQATLSRADMDPDGDGTIDADLTDRDPDNGEIYIEALLVTADGDPVPTQVGFPATVQSSVSSAGFVSEEGISRGPYANFAFDVSGFGADAPPVGDFAALIALSKSGVVDFDDPFDPEDSDTAGYLSRCDQMLGNGLTKTSSSYLSCIDSPDENEVYADIIMQSYEDGDGNTVVPEIQGVETIAMGVDADGDGTPDRMTSITGLQAIRCGSGDAAAPGVNTLRIDCPNLATTGDLNVGSDADINGNIDVSGNAEIGGGATISGDTDVGGNLFVRGEDVSMWRSGNEKPVISQRGDSQEITVTTNRALVDHDNDGTHDMDLGEAIQDIRILASGESMRKPICPATNANNEDMLPRIIATPASYADGDGRRTVGVRTIVEERENDWIVRLFQFVDEDFCTADIGREDDPISDRTSDDRCVSEDAGTGGPGSGPDGNADYYEIGVEDGRILAFSRCY